MHRASKLTGLQVSNDVSYCIILSHLSWIWTTLAWMSQSLVPQAQPKRIHPRLQRRQPSTYQVHGLPMPAVAQELRNSTSAQWFEVTFFDSFALLWFPYLNVTCWSYIILRYRIVTDFSFSKGPKNDYKISILKKVSNPWITKVEGRFRRSLLLPFPFDPSTVPWTNHEMCCHADPQKRQCLLMLGLNLLRQMLPRRHHLNSWRNWPSVLMYSSVSRGQPV